MARKQLKRPVNISSDKCSAWGELMRLFLSPTSRPLPPAAPTLLCIYSQIQQNGTIVLVLRQRGQCSLETISLFHLQQSVDKTDSQLEVKVKDPVLKVYISENVLIDLLSSLDVYKLYDA